VYTDIEDSTGAAAEHPAAMLLVQEVHDRLMRQGIQRFAGYEIHTQGDAFEVAFATAVSAVQFCLWVQDELATHDWSREVLGVTNFMESRDENGDVVFRGPRVRMGVHAALPGTWQKGVHGYTHHTVFGGEAVDLISVVSDAGHGGQVLLTKDAADALIPRIHKVDALLTSLGHFRVARGEDHVELELFDCQPLPTPKRPHRAFARDLRKITFLAPGRSLAVIPPPPALRDETGEEMFVVVCYAEEGTGDDPILADALAGVLAQQAQLAGGYLASPDACSEEGAVIVFRTDYGAAARFLAVLPVVLVWSDWPDTAKKSVVMEGTEPTRSIRVKLAMHVSSEVREVSTRPTDSTDASRASSSAFFESGAGSVESGVAVALDGASSGTPQKPNPNKPANRPTRRPSREGSFRVKGAWGHTLSDLGRQTQLTLSETFALADVDVDLDARDRAAGTAGGGVTLQDLVATASTRVEGPGVDVARATARATNPGQVVLTMAAFSFTQGSARMPAGAYPLSLGRHMITPEDVAAGRAQELYELVSTFLGPLRHPRLATARVVSAGYRQSPDPADAVAVCFVSIAAPDRDSPVTAAGLQLAAATLRETLETFGGYECKCPEPNKFTVAFSSFDDATSFTGALHLALLDAPWDAELLRKPGCGERRDATTGAVTWRGLHARCGVVHGKGTTRKPLNTGRADYFGAIPNLAARVCATAQYGQTLVEPTQGLVGATWHVEDGGAITGGVHVGPSAGAPEMRLDALGAFELKGVTQPAVLAQALPTKLRDARAAAFETPPGLVETPHALRAGVPATSIAERRPMDYRLGSFRSSFQTSRRGADAKARRGLGLVGCGVFSGGAAKDDARRATFRGSKSAAAQATDSGTVPLTPTSVDQVMLRMEEGAKDPAAAFATGGGGRRVSVDRWRSAGKTIVVRNRFKGARSLKMRERGGEDFGDLDDMPTLEQERAEDERRFASIGRGVAENTTTEEEGEDAGEDVAGEGTVGVGPAVPSSAPGAVAPVAGVPA
jgi:hypothetical protein